MILSFAPLVRHRDLRLLYAGEFVSLMLGYMSGSGPLLGNAESGLAAALAGTQFAVVSGGVLCVIGVFLSVCKLPLFWQYDSQNDRTNLIDSECVVQESAQPPSA